MATFIPELVRNRKAILANLTREEERFQRTVDSGMAKLESLLGRLESAAVERILPGEQAFELYATYGLPLEITRDIAREQELDVDEDGFGRPWTHTAWPPAPARPLVRWAVKTSTFYRELLIDLQAQR